jgi:hypothetical protein
VSGGATAAKAMPLTLSAKAAAPATAASLHVQAVKYFFFTFIVVSPFLKTHFEDHAKQKPVMS